MLAGDVIVQVDQRPVSSPTQVQANVDDSRKGGHASVFFLVARAQTRRLVVMTVR
jgi:S1-C subfamily serine protease